VLTRSSESNSVPYVYVPQSVDRGGAVAEANAVAFVVERPLRWVLLADMFPVAIVDRC
jgi:hypothetical protein